MFTDLIRTNTYRGRVIEAGVSELLAQVRAWQARRRANAELRRLDDRVLADIGIERGAIPAIVDGLVARGAPPANDNSATLVA